MEPERPIEKVLRSFAKKRREQAGEPVQLRPANRQELHREISRRSTSKGGAGFFSHLLFGLRPSLAFALCAVAIVIGGWLLLSNSHERKTETLASATYQTRKVTPAELPPPAAPPRPVNAAPASADMAKNMPETPAAVPEMPALQPAPPALAAANRERALSNDEAAKETDASKNGPTPQTSAPATIVASTATPNSETLAFKNEGAKADSFGSRVRLDSKDLTLVPATPTPPPASISTDKTTGNVFAVRDREAQKMQRLQAPPASSARTAFFASAAGESAASMPVMTSQIFNRVDAPEAQRRTSGGLTAPVTVLATFRVEQKGSAMRVFDADGSIYTGVVQAAEAEKIPATRSFDGTPKYKPFPSQANNFPSQTAQNYFFQVSGTNHNLKQNVVFSGSLIPLTNGAPQANGVVGGAGGAQGSLQPATLPSPILNSRISGAAVIGDQKEIEVNATPAAP